MLVPDSHSLSPITGSDYFDDETKKKIILNVSEGSAHIICYNYLHASSYVYIL